MVRTARCYNDKANVFFGHSTVFKRPFGGLICQFRCIFRLADVYLMKAEALVRMGGDLGEATRLVNAIRERAYGNSDHNYTSVTLDDIYNERGYELAFEFVRRQDMIRFGTYLKPRYMKPKQTPEYRKIFPIPFKAWQKNNNLVQNPGYPAF